MQSALESRAPACEVFQVGLIAAVLRSAPSSFRRTLAIALSILLLSASRAAAGDPAADVDVMIKKAVELRHQGKDQEALTELRRAAAIANPPRLSAQTGFAEQALGLWAAAEKHLQEGLDQGADPWIAKHRATLEQSLAFVRDRLATLDVWGSPEGAEILVNGEPMGTLPLASPLRVAAGTTQLSVRAKGFTTSFRTLELAAGIQRARACGPAGAGGAAPRRGHAADRRGGHGDVAVVAAGAGRGAPLNRQPLVVLDTGRRGRRGRRDGDRSRHAQERGRLHGRCDVQPVVRP